MGDLWTINLPNALGIVYLVDVVLGVVLGDIFVELKEELVTFKNSGEDASQVFRHL